MAYSSTTVSVGDPTEKADYDRLMDNTIYLKDGATVFKGAKTFQSSVTLSSTVTVDGAMTFSTAPDWRNTGYTVAVRGASGTATVTTLLTQIAEIGEWNMSTTESVLIEVGIDRTKWRHVQVLIRTDTPDEFRYDINVLYLGEVAGWWYSVAAALDTIRLGRVTGELFDAANFSDTSGYNRGWVTIEYIE